MTASSDPPSTPVEMRPAADALNTISTTVVIGCLAVAVLATGWVGLVMLGNSGWEQLFAFLGLSLAGLALLAVLPHALMLRWVRHHLRSPVSPWPTLAAVTATAIPFPATILTISREPPIEFIVPMAIFGMVLAVEIILMLVIDDTGTKKRSKPPANQRP